MKIGTRSYNHAVGEFNFHIQITPAFRQDPFADDRVLKLTKAYISAKMQELKIEIVAMEILERIKSLGGDMKNTTETTSNHDQLALDLEE